MEYFLNPFASVVHSERDSGSTVFVGNGITVECFHLKAATSILENNDSPCYSEGEKRTVCYLVVKGRLEFWLGEEKVQLGENESITVLPDGNFSVWALEESVLFAIHNNIEPDIDNTPQELVNAVGKVELRDRYLKGHNYRVAKYSTLMMQIIDPDYIILPFHLAAVYHDVGKVIVPEEILNKAGRLTDEEFRQIKKHPAESYEMLKGYLGTRVAGFARWHHEKLDGSGYPDGLRGDAIPLESRIMAVADIFDALTTSRCYRDAFSFDEALAIMRGDAENGKIDTGVLEVLEKLIRDGKIVDGVDNYRHPFDEKKNRQGDSR